MENKNNISIPSVIGSASLIICIILRVLSVMLKWGGAANAVFYIAVLITIIITAYRSFSQSEYNRACDFKENMKIYATGAAGGFIIQFIYCVISAGALADERYFNKASLISISAAGVFSLLSSLYFIAISLSCGKTSYDFRKLKILHFAPLLWSLCAIAHIIPNAPDFKTDVFSVLKALMLIFAMLFFYFFISETESESGAKKSTVFISKAFSYMCLLLFFSRAFEIIFKAETLYNCESLFALSALLIGTFAHQFRKGLADFT